MHATSLTARSYDDIPYDSVPISETYTENLAVQGALFGLSPARPERCRVLELGCASGGNLIPMAYRYPGAEFLGIDLSAGQVAAARTLIAELGLQNICIEQCDILDLGDIGHFDYRMARRARSIIP